MSTQALSSIDFALLGDVTGGYSFKETGKAAKTAADAAPVSEPAAAPADEAPPTETTQATDTDEKPTSNQDMSQPLSLF